MRTPAERNWAGQIPLKSQSEASASRIRLDAATATARACEGESGKRSSPNLNYKARSVPCIDERLDTWGRPARKALRP